MTATPPGNASLANELVLVVVAALSIAAVWSLCYGSPLVAALFLSPTNLATAFAAPLALSTLRHRRPVAALAFAAAAIAYPILVYWDRFPHGLGEIPPWNQLLAGDALTGLPCAVFGLLLLRKPRPVGGIPGPGLLLDALQAIVATCAVGILLSALIRGGLFGFGYLATSFALLWGLVKGAVVDGAVAAAAALVLLRGVRSPARLVGVAAFSAAALAPTASASPAAACAWCAAYAMTVLAYLSRTRLRGSRTAEPAPVPA